MTRALDRIKLIARFFKYVVTDPGCDCLLWIGARNYKGYGRIAVNGKKIYVHRLILSLCGEEVPSDLYVDHICKTRNCVNPLHLRVVTPHINAIENSVGPTAINKKKTECKHGHPFTPENTIIKDPVRGWRECRECHRISCLARFYRWRKDNPDAPTHGWSHAKCP